MKKRVVSIIRHIIQILSFLLFPGYFVFIWNALENVFNALIFNDFVWSAMQSSVLTLISVIPITIFFGRFFCGYICAFGSMQEFVSFIAEKLCVKKITLGKTADRQLKYIKYGILVLAVVIWVAEIYVADALSPWNVFGEYSSYKAWADLGGLFSIGGLLLLLIIIAAFFINRAFCRYFCPLGGLFTILSKLRIFRVKQNHKCVGCQLCSKKCVMGIDVNVETAEYGKVVSGECINCFECVKVCTPNALYTNSQEVVTGTAAAFSMVGLFYIGNAIPPITADIATPVPTYVETTEVGIVSERELGTDTITIAPNESDIPDDSSENANTPSTAPQQETIPLETLGKYQDGVYSGSGSGYRGTTTVSVVVSDGKITSITVESTNDDRQFMNRAKASVIDEILQVQGIDVQTVSGATYSSNGILEAVANALNIDFTNPNGTNTGGRRRH